MAAIVGHVQLAHERGGKNGALSEAVSDLVNAVLQLLAAHAPLLVAKHVQRVG